MNTDRIASSAPLPSVDERFEHLLISSQAVYRMLGKRRPGEVSFVESEQGDARRRLLQVEQATIKHKAQQASSHASFVNHVSRELHSLIIAELHTTLQSPDTVFKGVLALADAVPALLDTLSARACSMTRLAPHVAALPWLHDALLQKVNTPAFRRRDARGRIIVVTSLKTALSFLGLENLRLLIPALIAQRTLPPSTDPYPQIKPMLDDYTTGTAVAARHLASLGEVPPFEGYVLGMFSTIGRCALVRLYFRLFNQFQHEQLHLAQQKKQREKHEALLHLTPSPDYLIALQQEYAERLSAEMVEHMQLRHLALAGAVRQYTNDNTITPGSAADVLRLAQRYTRTRLLHRYRALEQHEAKTVLRRQAYPSGALTTLKATNIFSLPFTQA